MAEETITITSDAYIVAIEDKYTIPVKIHSRVRQIHPASTTGKDGGFQVV